MGTKLPTDVTSLADAAQHQIGLAREACHGRSARTVRGGHDRALRQTVVALRAGATLREHDNSREATLHPAAAGGGEPGYSWQEDWS